MQFLHLPKHQDGENNPVNYDRESHREDKSPTTPVSNSLEAAMISFFPIQLPILGRVLVGQPKSPLLLCLGIRFFKFQLAARRLRASEGLSGFFISRHPSVDFVQSVAGRKKMKELAFSILFFASAAVFGDDFKTIDGKEYKNVTVSRVEPDGIVVTTSSGVSKVYFTELPKDVQERFHYDAAKALSLRLEKTRKYRRLDNNESKKRKSGQKKERNIGTNKHKSKASNRPRYSDYGKQPNSDAK